MRASQTRSLGSQAHLVHGDQAVGGAEVYAKNSSHTEIPILPKTSGRAWPTVLNAATATGAELFKVQAA